MNKKRELKEFTTTDIFLCSYILCKGLQLCGTRRKDNNQLVFVIADNPSRPELVDKFYSNKASVDPLMYKNRLRDLKSLLYNSD